ncbi:MULTISPECIES: SURF1 family protein [unclassified Sphingobium]|uniref:SURF1 family protein n=1 Tax=unclassified Sphingobium TaxID=2611147 RepID=UPI00076FE859|nr:SURF1 family protein [Sphingobium sp. TKS]AMK23788.1 Surf1 protein [Sphingobium sp. TKS]NML89551.1 SURF1 family protein [Sphingobium sp. TB-6]
MKTAQDGGRSRRSPAFLIGLTLIALLFFAGFCALGAWQVQRLSWKRDLIARVDARIHARPIPAPRAAARADEYRRVRISGHFLHGKTALVQAVTVRGPGFWVLTPLVTDQGFTLIVNRGFVPPDRRRDYARPQGEVHVAGLLRLSEPGGGFLRSNDPATDRWYSRDVAAIAAARGIDGPTADYFIDADAASGPDSLPVGGLTVIKFPNSHLQYAITWFVLAAMVAGAYMFVMRQERKDRRG